MPNDPLDDFAIRWIAAKNNEGRNGCNRPTFITSSLPALGREPISTEAGEATTLFRTLRREVAAFRHRQMRRREGVAHG